MKTMRFLMGFLFSIFLLSACSKEFDENIQPSPNSGEKVRLELVTNAGDYSLPSMLRSGSANENEVGTTPWIIVYHGTGATAVFYEAVQSIELGSKTYVNLTQTSSPCRVIIIANPPAMFNNGASDVPFNAEYLTNYLSTAGGFSLATSMMTTAQLSVPQTSVPYASLMTPQSFIPMSTVIDLPNIDGATTLGTVTDKLILTRVVAKVTIESSNPDIVIEGATVVNVPQSGWFFRSGSTLKNNSTTLTDYIADAGDPVTGIAEATNNSTILNPIYLYESRNQENTRLIVKMSYDGGSYYYCLAFKNMSDAVAFDILRNKYYKFVINSVGKHGYSTFEEAKASLPANYSISYSISVTDQLSHDMADNGEYYLGLSNSQFFAYTSDIENNLLAFTITTNAPQGTSNSISITSGSGVTLNQALINLSPGAGASATTDVGINILDPTSGENVITVRLGNLIKKVTIRMGPKFEASGSFLTLTPDYVFGSVTTGFPWLFLTTNGTSQVGHVSLLTPGTIYLGATVNDTGTARTGEAYFSCNENGGRQKYFVKQVASN